MKLVGLDTETFLITEESPIPKLVCMSVSDGQETQLYKDDNPLLLTVLENLLKDDDITIVAHSASFDFSVLAVAFPEMMFLINKKYKDGKIICTKMNEKLIRLAYDGSIDGKEFSLAFCVEKYLGIDISKDKTEDSWRLNYNKLIDVPMENWDSEAVRYAKMDAVYCLNVFKKQLGVKKIKDVRVQSYCDWLGTITTKVEGLKVDNGFLETKLSELQKLISEQDEILVRLNFKEPKSKKDLTLKKNTSVIKEVVSQLYISMGLDVPTTDKGNISCDADSLGFLEGKHEGIDALLKIGSASTSVNTFLLAWQGKEEIKPSLDMLKATGRMSCYSPNLQNVPRNGRIRGCIVPREGYYFCSIDYSQLELLALAQVTHTMFQEYGVVSQMLLAINQGKDLHCVTGSNIMGCSYEEFIQQLALKDKIFKQYRQMSKAGNFGYPGGLMYKTFVDYARTSYGVIVTEEEAKKIREAFFLAYPEVEFYHRYMERLLVTKDIGTFYECKQVFTDRVRMVPDSAYCSACNTFFQGLASDGVKQAFIDVCNATFFGDLKSIPKLVVHDEIIFEVPIDNAHEEAMALSKIMINAMSKFLPDVKIIKAEPALMTRWEKEAESVYDSNGKLTVWEKMDKITDYLLTFYVDGRLGKVAIRFKKDLDINPKYFKEKEEKAFLEEFIPKGADIVACDVLDNIIDLQVHII
jgi:DNA polymerase I-like protein with 3'-5' exonuclease and polymerase domains